MSAIQQALKDYLSKWSEHDLTLRAAHEAQAARLQLAPIKFVKDKK